VALCLKTRILIETKKHSLPVNAKCLDKQDFGRIIRVLYRQFGPLNSNRSRFMEALHVFSPTSSAGSRSCPPTVFQSRVCMGTTGTEFNVFGLCNTQTQGCQ